MLRNEFCETSRTIRLKTAMEGIRMGLESAESRIKRLSALIIVSTIVFTCLALLCGCGLRIGADAEQKDTNLIFDAAYCVGQGENTSELFVFCTLKGNDEKNTYMAADQAKLEFDSNRYSDDYSLNKTRNDRYIKAATAYSGVTDGSHGTIYASSGDTEKVAFEFHVGNHDLETSKDATLDWVSYRATVPINEIQRVDSMEQMVELLAQQQ